MTAALQTDIPLEKTPLERYVPPAKPSLVGLTRAALAEALGAIGVAPAQQKMRVQQLWHWIYVRGVQSFDQMTSVSKELRAVLDSPLHAGASRGGGRAGFGRRHAQVAASPAGEVEGERPHEVECVYIPESDRGTLCVSSQVGCTLTCSFCHTGTQRLVRNLTPEEIVGQVMVARDRLGDFIGSERAQGPGLPTEGERCISNIVMMGMGEPLAEKIEKAEARIVSKPADEVHNLIRGLSPFPGAWFELELGGAVASRHCARPGRGFGRAGGACWRGAHHCLRQVRCGSSRCSARARAPWMLRPSCAEPERFPAPSADAPLQAHHRI